MSASKLLSGVELLLVGHSQLERGPDRTLLHSMMGSPVSAVHRKHGQPVALVQQKERVQEHQDLPPHAVRQALRPKGERSVLHTERARACCTNSSGGSAEKSAALAPWLAAISRSQNSPRVSRSTTSRLLSSGHPRQAQVEL